MQSSSHDISQRQAWECNLLEVDKIKIKRADIVKRKRAEK